MWHVSENSVGNTDQFCTSAAGGIFLILCWNVAKNSITNETVRETSLENGLIAELVTTWNHANIPHLNQWLFYHVIIETAIDNLKSYHEFINQWLFSLSAK